MRTPSICSSDDQRIGGWIETFTGVVFYPLDPRPEEICIEDVAHSLSLQCRFAGHCREFYSVAEHSVRVSRELPAELALWGLLHDAAEAYLVDLRRPIKRFSEMGKLYRGIEAQLMLSVCDRFGLDIVEPPEVKRIDNALLMTEKRDLLGNGCAKAWEDTELPLAGRIKPWKPKVAERRFLTAFARLSSISPSASVARPVNGSPCEGEQRSPGACER
jgi:uncharacterized protein